MNTEDLFLVLDEAKAQAAEVVERRHVRDLDGDPEDLDSAMHVIAEQDEDIDLLLGAIGRIADWLGAE